MHNQEVTITDGRIYYSDRPTSIVMDEVSKDLMKTYSDIVCQNGGHVLDIGFGLGYSANFIYENVGNYTCIEINPQIYQTALEWAKDKPNVNIIHGNWVDVIPTLTQKFDGIFMDTFGDVNYYKFEDYAKLISNENCILSIYEYAKLRNNSELNNIVVPVHSKKYPKIINNNKEVSWAYFVAGEFRKDKFYKEIKSLLSIDMCNQIINDNKLTLKPHEESAEVKNVKHTRRLDYTEIKHNQQFIDILNKKVFNEYNDISFEDLWVRLFRYKVGDLYDRHVETIKGIPLNDSEQYCTTIDITLNNSYEGGETDIYDSWSRNNRDVYVTLTPNSGDCLIYKPHHHVSYNTPTYGERYQIVILVKNKNLKKKIENII